MAAHAIPQWGDISDLIRHLDLKVLGGGVYEAPAHGEAPRDVVEGAHLMGQAIVAASRAVPGQRAVSAHAIFCRASTYAEPVRFETAIRHKGRTFSTVSVTASQGGKEVSPALVMLDAGAPDAIRHQAAMPDVPGPEVSPAYEFGVSGRELRVVNGAYTNDPADVGPPQLHAWLRLREAPDELCLRQAMLCDFMGRLSVAAAMRPHAGVGEAMAHVSLSTGVLAITAGLHEDPDLSDWLLYSSDASHLGRGLGQVDGRVFERSGRLVASSAMRIMIRPFGQDPAAHGGFTRAM